MKPECAALAELLSALADGELTGPDRERALAHLGVCPDCRRLVETYRRLDAAVADGPAPQAVPPDRWDRMLGEIKRAGNVRTVAVLRPAPARRLRAVAFALAAAAAVLLAVALLATRGRTTGPDYSSAEIVNVVASERTLVMDAPEGGLSLVFVSSAPEPEPSEKEAGG